MIHDNEGVHRTGALNHARESNSVMTVSHRPATKDDFMRMSVLFWRSSDVAHYQGPLMCRAAVIWLPASFGWLVLRRRRPSIIAAECEGRLIGGILLSPLGKFETMALDKSHRLRRECFALLVREVENILRGAPDRRFDYWTLHPTILREGLRLGFRRTDRERYVVTAELGPLRCSWLAHRPITRPPFLRSSRIHYMCRYGVLN